jgi:hypothetical protein
MLGFDILNNVLARFRRLWELKIMETLNRRAGQSGNYVLLRSEQVCDAVLQ